VTVRFELPLRVTAVSTPCSGVRSLTFVHDDGGALPSFPPGSHIGLEGAGFYSLTGPMREPDHLSVSVALRPDGSGGSRRMHALAVGDRIRATLPRSTFAPVETARHHVLVAGGIGVTPIVSHARWHAFWGHSFEVVYAHRPGAGVHADDLRALCGDRLRTVTGRDALRAALEPSLRSAPFGSHVYTCGPPAMIDAVAALACDAHWVDGRIHSEAFVADTTPGEPFRAVLRASGRTVDVAADETLLDALARSGVDAPSLCRQGVCGECVTTVHDGRIDHRDSVVPESERDTRMALCVSRADGTTLELDL
jgi:dimethylamine monooxygenase subunit B